MHNPPRILIVDDEPFNVDCLEQELEDLNYQTISARNGQEALAQMASGTPDLVLLDIHMPLMDGFEVLKHLKSRDETRDVPVIIISADDDIDNVAQGIEMGAEDYLPKPFEPIVLEARLSACLERRRLREKDLDVLRQVEVLIEVAHAVEDGSYDDARLTPLTAREDALGRLGSVFQRMAREVVAREQRLHLQCAQLQLDIADRTRSAAQTMASYVPVDRRIAIVNGTPLREHTQGAALFADISGFTPLTESLVFELGLQRGAEELVRHLNRIFGALNDQVHRFAGSVIGFSGDAITCWFDAHAAPDGADTAERRAAACALAMQSAIASIGSVVTGEGTEHILSIKVAITAGPVRRLFVGTPEGQRFEALAGPIMERLAVIESHALNREVLVDGALALALSHDALIAEERGDDNARIAVLTGLKGEVPTTPWSEDALQAFEAHEDARPWVMDALHTRLAEGQSEFLAELRVATAFFLRFSGIDFEREEAGTQLERFMMWVQSVLADHHGHVIQLSIGEKGSYLYAVFGTPHGDGHDAGHALNAANILRQPPQSCAFITGVQIGVTRGRMRVGAYGSAARCTYGVLGDKTNLAARLMLAAPNGQILCDKAVAEAARNFWRCEALPPISVKGKSNPVEIFQPHTSLHDDASLQRRIDALEPGPLLTLKVASLLGESFDDTMLAAVLPVQTVRDELARHLEALIREDFVTRQGGRVVFANPFTRSYVAAGMLAAQRRHLHEVIARWYETTHASDLTPYVATLAHHWEAAEGWSKAIDYLEKAGMNAREEGRFERAMALLQRARTLEAETSVLRQPIAPS